MRGRKAQESGRKGPAITPKHEPPRDPSGRWIKGYSANPKGRPTTDPELRAAARSYTIEAIETLARWMRSDDPVASVAAARELLNRGHGRPEHTGQPLVAVTFAPGAAIVDSSAAARAYAEIIGRPDADLDAITFEGEASQ